jgi:SAM-dependent methyltransferase
MTEADRRKYSADAHVAEIYDAIETETDDVDLLVRLIGPRRGLTILEPFCGTGRLAIPLARQGHRVLGLDESEGMLERCQMKLQAEPTEVRARLQTTAASALASDWPAPVDVVLLGGNCLYEFGSLEDQRALVHRAAAALRPGGHVFLDNDDHQSLELSPRWRSPPGRPGPAFPSGRCQDGTLLEGTTETASFDVPGRLVHYLRRLKVTHPDGEVTHREWRETCRPVVMAEMLEWVAEACLAVKQTYGDRQGNPYGPASYRAIVWAARPKP